MFNLLKKCYLVLEKYFLILIFALMGFNMFLQVVLRYLFNYPLPFGEELSRYLQIWLTFFGLTFVLRQDGHIRMGALYSRVSPFTQRILSIITNLCVLSALFVFLPGSIAYYMNQIPVHWLGIPWISMAVTAFCIPLSTVMLILYYIGDTVKSVRLLISAPKSTFERAGE
jgi:TRAP-type C4-dicarboxylate transport system permease small subunit